ncbi:cystinosin [Metarhizium rileyi]|uniref:Cystinosin n=1 Tax=Metarhizium rileyi (strain RCEF 4871) TaxID=1649241 RepID=A0A167KNP6_METRR|nr:cystinosin [Metarhizium rileyi RCEF 4871]
MGFLSFVSGVFGWIYTLCWSASFYPQLVLNFRRRSTSGTTVDFPFINVLGFVAYFVSNIAFYYSPVIRSQYAARHNGLTPTVQFNDITFALHASIISSITLSQYLLRPLWGFTSAGGTRPSRFIVGLALGCLLGVFATYLVVASAAARGPVDPATDWCQLDIVYAVGYVKLLITLIKFTPQILANYRNQSTKGWSIWQVTLDFVGGVLSTGQQGIDSYLQRDWSGVTGNPVKFALGNASMVYDCIFFFQHYILYRAAYSKHTSEEDALLGDEERQRRRRLD